MAKHKAKLLTHDAAYLPWAVVGARTEFLANVAEAQESGDWRKAQATVMRGRQGTVLRTWSDRVRVQKQRQTVADVLADDIEYIRSEADNFHGPAVSGFLAGLEYALSLVTGATVD